MSDGLGDDDPVDEAVQEHREDLSDQEQSAEQSEKRQSDPRPERRGP
jgi:hypothetical protein